VAEQLGVGVIGLGWVAGEHVKAYQHEPRTKVVAVAGRDPAKTRARADELGLDARVHDGWEQLLRDPAVQMVSICTPHKLHARQAIAAAQAGKHVLVEKPIALTLGELRALRDAVRSAGVKGMCSFVLRWNPMLVAIDEQVRAGALGRLSLARVDYWNRSRKGVARRGPWGTIADSGSALLEGGCHAADTLRWLVGAEAVEVQAMGTSRHDTFEFPPTIVVNVRFANGTVGQLTTSLEGGLPYAFNVDLIGTRGGVRDARLTLLEGESEFAQREIPGNRPDSRDVSHHPFPGEIAAFADAVLTGVDPPANVEDAVRTHELCIAADISAAEGGRPVKLPLLS
jgi:predicted dehydrogenase